MKPPASGWHGNHKDEVHLRKYHRSLRQARSRPGNSRGPDVSRTTIRMTSAPGPSQAADNTGRLAKSKGGPSKPESPSTLQQAQRRQTTRGDLPRPQDSRAESE
jgi:hypothetical protein